MHQELRPGLLEAKHINIYRQNIGLGRGSVADDCWNCNGIFLNVRKKVMRRFADEEICRHPQTPNRQQNKRQKKRGHHHLQQQSLSRKLLHPLATGINKIPLESPRILLSLCRASVCPSGDGRGASQGTLYGWRPGRSPQGAGTPVSTRQSGRLGREGGFPAWGLVKADRTK